MYPQCMCILLYMKLIWCNVFHGSIVQLGMWGVHVSSIYVHSAICETYLVYGIPYIYCQLGKGVHVSTVYVHSAICETYLV